MKKMIVIFFIVIILCGCSATEEQVTGAISSQSTKVEAKETIPPFEKEEREILPLPENTAFSDGLEFVDSLIANYEVLQYQEFDAEFELRDMQIEKSNEGPILMGQSASSYDTGSINLAKPLSEYFNTPDNHYGVLVRFKSDQIDRLCFNFDSRFGRIMLDFFEGKHPAIDLAGDSYGDPMFYDNWNNYVYEPAEWACVFMTINNFGQKTCYVWGEDDPTDYSFKHSYGEPYGDDRPFNFEIRVGENGETVTVSGIWLFSYEEAKV